jgi:hypothetical protein
MEDRGHDYFRKKRHQEQGTIRRVAFLECKFKMEIITRDGVQRKFQNMGHDGPCGPDSEPGI